MKKLKSEAREWIFENLLRLLFRFANSHKLIRFQKIPHHRKQNEIDYNLIIRSKASEDKKDLKERLENYLTDLTNKDVFKIPSTIYPGKFHKNISSSHEGKVLNEEESYLNLTYKKLQTEDLEKITESYKDLQVRTLKRSINENGYEIISEVKNGFIIARKDRHDSIEMISNYKPVNGEQSDYVHKLIGTLGESDKWIKEQLSISDLSKQGLEKEKEIEDYYKFLEEQDKENQEYNRDIKDLENSTDEPTWRDFANENKLSRFLDEDPDKYMERVKSAMRSKFTKSSLHPFSGVIDNTKNALEEAKIISNLAKEKLNAMANKRANNAEF